MEKPRFIKFDMLVYKHTNYQLRAAFLYAWFKANPNRLDYHEKQIAKILHWSVYTVTRYINILLAYHLLSMEKDDEGNLTLQLKDLSDKSD